MTEKVIRLPLTAEAEAILTVAVTEARIAQDIAVEQLAAIVAPDNEELAAAKDHFAGLVALEKALDAAAGVVLEFRVPPRESKLPHDELRRILKWLSEPDE